MLYPSICRYSSNHPQLPRLVVIAPDSDRVYDVLTEPFRQGWIPLFDVVANHRLAFLRRRTDRVRPDQLAFPGRGVVVIEWPLDGFLRPLFYRSSSHL